MWSFRRMEPGDSLAVFALMREMYDRAARRGAAISDDTLWQNIDNCLSAYPHVEAWVCDGPAGLAAYALCSLGYDARHAKNYVRLEDLYVTPSLRHLPMGTDFLAQLPQLYPGCTAISLELPEKAPQGTYRRCGFTRSDVLMWTDQRG